jgi:plasmid stabilization system protein ParE
VIRLQIYEAAALAIVEQADYYFEKAGPSLASKWESAVNKAVVSLLRQPEIGSPCRFRSPALAGLRWTLVPGFPKNLIFYRYAHAENTLFVVHALHGARDIESIFSEEEDTK